jgi:hypothetical protein
VVCGFIEGREFAAAVILFDGERDGSFLWQRRENSRPPPVVVEPHEGEALWAHRERAHAAHALGERFLRGALGGLPAVRARRFPEFSARLGHSDVGQAVR